MSLEVAKETSSPFASNQSTLSESEFVIGKDLQGYCELKAWKLRSLLPPDLAHTDCQTSFKSLTGPNGFPDGTCTDLRRSGAYGSFQIVSLDPGCAVTIYSNDTTNDPCSAYPEDTAVGGVVGGILGLALIIGVVFWATRRQRFEQQAAAIQQSSVIQHSELQDYQHSELGVGKVLYKRQAVEVEVPPVEIGGQEVQSSFKTSP
ncbi:hypothetical protein OPT61_g5604 [Boeremia exigua]|uniref:Uncharacterized protein n=1 Tax=Boeremia exigua TaxID=749465 RepID=A0ACC2I9P8_9PLEO|nr:hypothetical protein OPT61_g5604 [Boeremia exigua]